MTTVIIIGHNSRLFLPTCLASVVSQEAPVAEIIYIDNHSADHSAEYITSRFPQVKVVTNETNVGFAKAANQGIALARSPFVLLLNPDMILDRTYLSEAMAVLEDVPKTAAVIGKIYKYDFIRNRTTKIIDTMGLVALRNRRFLDLGAAITDRGQFDLSQEIFGVPANCALFRKTALVDAQISGECFDEDFFMYKEDVDLSWRLRLLGWSFLYTPKAVAYHGRGTGVENRLTLRGTIAGRKGLNHLQKYYSLKNHHLMIFKNDLWPNLFKDLVVILLRELSLCFWLLVFEPKMLRAMSEVLAQLPNILSKRAVIMKRKRISHRDMQPWLRGKGLATN